MKWIFECSILFFGALNYVLIALLRLLFNIHCVQAFRLVLSFHSKQIRTDCVWCVRIMK